MNHSPSWSDNALEHIFSSLTPSPFALTISRGLAEATDTTCWYGGITRWFTCMGLQMDMLYPFQYSFDAPHALNRHETNWIIREDLLQLWTFRPWISSIKLPPPKLSTYCDHFLLSSDDGFVIPAGYVQIHLSHALCIALGQLWVSSHQLHIETSRAQGLDRDQRICHLCSIEEADSEEHFIFRCLVYYKIRERYHCLFYYGFDQLRRVMSYDDQRCVALFVFEAHSLRNRFMRQHSYAKDPQSCITTFFEPQSHDQLDIPHLRDEPTLSRQVQP